MKSLKLNLFEFRKELNIEQAEIANIVSEHIELTDKFSEKEVFSSLNKTLETYKFYDNVKLFLENTDNEMSENPVFYTLKDLYSKIARKEYRFLYENALTTLLECINVTNNEDRKIKILNDLKLYEWIPEIKQFLYEMASTPQMKQNFKSNGGMINDVYSIVLQLKEGYLTFVKDKLFIMNNEGVIATLLENHVKNDIQLKKLRLLEQAVQKAKFESDKITFEVAENLTVTINTKDNKLFLNESEVDKNTTLETLFNSPVLPFMAKGFYPIINETFNNLKLFMNLDNVKNVYNPMSPAFECYVFNYNNTIYQYRIDNYSGNSYLKYENAMAIIENVMQELGADLTFFYENMLSEEIKNKIEYEKQEKKILEKIEDVENNILKIKDEAAEDLKENKMVINIYNALLVKKHKLNEELKIVRNKKIGTLKELPNTVKQIIKEEIQTNDVKTGGTYIAQMPTSNDGKQRVDVKVKVLGPYKDYGDDYFTIEVLEDKDYINPVNNQPNSYSKGKHYYTQAKYLKQIIKEEKMLNEELHWNKEMREATSLNFLNQYVAQDKVNRTIQQGQGNTAGFWVLTDKKEKYIYYFESLGGDKVKFYQNQPIR